MRFNAYRERERSSVGGLVGNYFVVRVAGEALPLSEPSADLSYPEDFRVADPGIAFGPRFKRGFCLDVGF
jgi:hypothetical protein